MNILKKFFIVLGLLLISGNMALYAQLFKNTEKSSFVARIPIGFSWWTPSDDEWRQSLSGIAGIRTGIEIFPVKKGLTPEDGIFRLYFRSLLNWRIGSGNQNTYRAIFNEFGIQAGIFTRLNITDRHSIYAGAGPLWSLEYYSFNPKYGSKKNVTRRGTAFFVTGGYSFQFKSKLAAFMEVEYDSFITEGLMNSIVPSLGITFGL